jgi:two-component system chemotaxis sensor kinase CheA
MQDQDIVHEFLVESHENLSRLDRELVALEESPKDAELLGSIFRTIHTIKGTCGFLALSTLENITHHAESLLSQLREGKRDLTPPLVSLILETVDATRKVLASLEATGTEGEDRFAGLADRLCAAAKFSPIPEVEAPVDPAGPREEDTGREDAAREDGGRMSAVADANVRVDVGLLDKLMDLVGELVLARNQILQFSSEREDAALTATSQRLNLITSELQEGVMKTRMQPIGTVWNKLPRVVRDVALALGKQIKVEMEGAGTELDRTIMEAIKDPLVHLVRNACDHGIESPEVRARAGKPTQGRLTLRAYHEGGQVNIEISDDGAGIDVAVVKRKAVEKGLLGPDQAEKLSDREAMHLIFRAGLSTARSVTNVSGRGVGMDVVKANVEKIGGVVDVLSRPGGGTTVKLKIPLTLAIIPGLVVTHGNPRSAPRPGSGTGERYLIPQVSLVELIRLEGHAVGSKIELIHGTPVYRRRGRLLPIVFLHDVLEVKPTKGSSVVNIVVVQAEDQQFGLVVDGIHDTQEIVVKPLSKQLKGVNIYAGATIMGDGRVALILDVLGIGKRAGVLGEARETARPAAKQESRPEIEQQRLLLFRAGSFERLAVPLSLVARLEEFPRSSIEHASGGEVVQYRNRILPLITLRAVLDPEAPAQTLPDPLQVVVFNDGDRNIGLVVDQILDVAKEAVTVRQRSRRLGLLGSALVGEQVVDFLDLNQIIRGGAGTWFDSHNESSGGKGVLLAEASPFSRGLLRSGLHMAGYRVTEAATLDEVIRGLEQQAVDVVVTSMDVPPEGSGAVLAAVRRRPEWKQIPVLALAESAAEASAIRLAGYEDCQVKFDLEAMLESVSRLASALAAAEPVFAGER